MNLHKLQNNIKYDYYDHLNSAKEWAEISTRKLDAAFINRYKDKLSLDDVFHHNKLTEKQIEKLLPNLYNITEMALLETHQLSEEFLEKYLDYFAIYRICKYQKISEQFIEKHNLDLFSTSWDCLSRNKLIQFSPEFLLKYKDKLNWTWITRYQDCIFEEKNCNQFIKLIKFDKIKFRKSFPETTPAFFYTYHPLLNHKRIFG